MVYVRKFRTRREAKGFKMPNRGKLADAERGEQNLIRVAYDLRDEPVVLCLPTEAPPTAAAVVPVAPRVVPVRHVGTRGEEQPSASMFLADPAWTAHFDATFSGAVSVSSCGTDADDLAAALRQRLAQHIEGKIADPTKRQSWVWDFVRDNVSRMAAMVVRCNHVKTDVACQRPSDSLLPADVTHFRRITLGTAGAAAGGTRTIVRAPSRYAGGGRLREPSARGRAATRRAAQVGAATVVAELEGAYLFFDKQRATFVRSGKVSGRPFPERLAEHAKGAALSTSVSQGSKFYRSYPTRAGAAEVEATQGNAPAGRRGYFDDLVATVALGYKSSDGLAVVEHFVWADDVTPCIARLNFRGAQGLPEKKMHCVGYLIELIYGLLLAPDADVSINPGFEVCLGIFGPS